MRRAAVSVLVVAAALVLAFVPSALASHITEVSAQSVTLGPGGSVIVSGTIQCTEGYSYFVSAVVRQRSGMEYNTAFGGFFGSTGTCLSTGPQSYTTDPLFGQGPFHPGPATVQSSVTLCDSFGSFSDCAFDQELKDIRIRA